MAQVTRVPLDLPNTPGPSRGRVGQQTGYPGGDPERPNRDLYATHWVDGRWGEITHFVSGPGGGYGWCGRAFATAGPMTSCDSAATARGRRCSR